MKLQNKNSMDDRPCDWLIKVGDYFQPNYMNIWSNGSNITEASALLSPISLHEELTKCGAGQKITSMLLIRGIFGTH